MTAHLKKSRLFAEPAVIAGAICRALESGSPSVVYTPGYWRYIMLAVRAIPGPIFNWMTNRREPPSSQ
jgi:hypothetical protein